MLKDTMAMKGIKTEKKPKSSTQGTRLGTMDRDRTMITSATVKKRDGE